MYVPVPKSKKKQKTLLKIIAIPAIILGLCILFFCATAEEPVFVPAGTVKAADMNDTDVYEFKDILVFDLYASITYEDSNKNIDYYLVGFTDADGTVKTASLLCNAEDDVFSKLEAYVDDESLEVGDCYVDLCATVDSMQYLDDDINQWYKEAVEYFEDIGAEINSSGLSFAYACNSSDDFAEYLEKDKENNMWGIGVGAAFVLIGLLCAVLGFRKNKNEPPAPDTTGYGIYYNPSAEKQSYDNT